MSPTPTSTAKTHVCAQPRLCLPRPRRRAGGVATVRLYNGWRTDSSHFGRPR